MYILTIAGLQVHMTQVHKETLSHVENAIAGRQNLDIEIFGMEGVPEDTLDLHNQQVTQKHFAEEAERQRLTGNPARGALANGDGPANKRARVHETLEDIERRAEQYRQDRINGVLPAPAPEAKKEVSRRLLIVLYAANEVSDTTRCTTLWRCPWRRGAPFCSYSRLPRLPSVTSRQRTRRLQLAPTPRNRQSTAWCSAARRDIRIVG
jgi:hypothetical protein